MSITERVGKERRMKLLIEEQCPVSGSRPRDKGEPGFLSLALPAFLPSAILFCFFFNRKLGGWPKAPSPRSVQWCWFDKQTRVK